MPNLCFIVYSVALAVALLSSSGCNSTADGACRQSVSTMMEPPELPRVAVLRLGNFKREDSREMHDHGTGLANDWRAAAAVLKAQQADVVVIRFDSLGGRASAFIELAEVFRAEYLPMFRVVAWVHMANEAAVLPLLAIQERVFAPNGFVYCNPGWREDPCPEIHPSDWLSTDDIETFARTTPDPAWTEALFFLLYGNTAEDLGTTQARQLEVFLGRDSLRALKPDPALQLGVSKGEAADLRGVLALMNIHEWRECGPEAQARLDASAASRAATLAHLMSLSGRVRALAADRLMTPSVFCREYLPCSHKDLHEELVRLAMESPELMREACLDPAWFLP